MRLVDRTETRFELTIQGYEFPDKEYEEYDSNWLNVRIDVTSPTGSWISIHPSLLTYEAAKLASWLEGLGSGGGPTELGFIEPNLGFELRRDDLGVRVLRIYFDLESRPPWSASRTASEKDCWIDLICEDLDLVNVVADIRQQLRRYPQRARV